MARVTGRSAISRGGEWRLCCREHQQIPQGFARLVRETQLLLSPRVLLHRIRRKTESYEGIGLPPQAKICVWCIASDTWRRRPPGSNEGAAARSCVVGNRARADRCGARRGARPDDRIPCRIRKKSPSDDCHRALRAAHRRRHAPQPPAAGVGFRAHPGAGRRRVAGVS